MAVTTAGELGRADTRSAERDRTAIRRWLYVVLVTLLTLVVVGGATRLTDSGLSITEWKPIHGTIPPLSAAEWEEEFAKYREIPEYRYVNRGMSMDEFKVIFWWEWGHRFLARTVGLIFAVPLAFFWLTGRIEPWLKPRLLALLALGGLQGFIGWWMVASGLSVRTDVSQYRLAVHLTMASIIIAAIVWVARSIRPGESARSISTTRTAGVLAGVILVQIYLGALVAGMDAGMAYNTWPLMEGALVPGGLLAIDPAWLNAFENAKTVQFIHRSFAFVVLSVAFFHAWRALAVEGWNNAGRLSVLLTGLVVMQAVIGIVTLLLVIPISWALLHQAMAIVVLGVATWHWRGAKGTKPLPSAG